MSKMDCATERSAGYLNWDDSRMAAQIRRAELPPREPLLVFDEIHKYARWWLKILENLYVCFRVAPFGVPRFFQIHLGERHYSTGRITVLPFARFCEELGMP